MAKTLQQILGTSTLVGVIQSVKGGVPTDILPPEFMRVGRTIEGNTGTYDKVEGNRKTARLAHYGSKAKKRSLKGVSEVPITLMHTFESMDHRPDTLMQLRDIGNESRQKLGQNEIARQTKDFKDLFLNLRVTSAVSALTAGAIYFDSDGNLLPSSGGATYTIDFDVPAVNQNQIDGIVTASWNTAGTDIVKQVKAIKLKARQTSGYPLKHAFVGSDILGYFLKNTTLKELINRNAGFQASAAAGTIPDGFLGFMWHDLDEFFFEDNDSTNQTLMGTSDVIFTPEVSPEWWELVQGTFPVPTKLGGVGGEAADMIADITEVAGMFSYAVIGHNPVGIEQFAGDTFLPTLKVPSAIFQAVVHGF